MDLICVPTLLSAKETRHIYKNILNTTCRKRHKIVISNLNASAPTNRNWCLLQADIIKPRYVIMCDDDISGYYNGWADNLIKPFELYKNCVMVSASLVNKDGSAAIMMNHKRDFGLEYQVVNDALPSACVAFKHDPELRFDERYTIENKGSGYEDADMCMQLNRKHNGIYVINNKVKLIHNNHKCNQENIQYFGSLFRQKWFVK